MPRTAISGLVCTTFLVLLGFPAVPQEPAAKGADTESGQQTFNNACRTCHTTKEGDNRLGPNLHNIIGRKAGSLQNYGYSSAGSVSWRLSPMCVLISLAIRSGRSRAFQWLFRRSPKLGSFVIAPCSERTSRSNSE